MAGYAISYVDATGMEYALYDQITRYSKPGGMHGFATLEPSIATQRVPYTHGVAVLGEPVTLDRTMSVAVQIQAASYSAWVLAYRTLQQNVNLYLDPATQGYLKIVTPDGLARRVACWCVGCSDPEMDGPVFGTVILTFWSPTPWFYDPTANTITLSVAGSGGITFPITFPITFTATTINEHVTAHNSGSIDSWPTIRINGPGVNPTVENETAVKTLALTAGGGVTMDAGDYITISMGLATITWYDLSGGTTTSIITKMSAASEFWSLGVGDNTLHVTMSGAYSGSVVFTFTDYYLAL